MRKAKFILRMTQTADLQEHSCLGEQLAQILTCVLDETKNYSWYVFDIDYYTAVTNKLFSSPICRIDKTIDLIDKVKQVHQFLSGVFIAINREKAINWDVEFLPSTEEEEGLQHDDAELEIRAFDTTYFEIYCMNTVIENKLRSKFDSV